MLDYFLYYYTVLLRVSIYKPTDNQNKRKEREMRNKWLYARNWCLFFYVFIREDEVLLGQSA